MDKRFLKTLPVAGVLTGVLVVSAFSILWKHEEIKKGPSALELPIYGRVPGFKLAERSGRQITLRDLKGTPWIADFIFTRCAGICPMMTSTMNTLAHEMPEARFVSFSVDPEYDTPEILAGYAKSYEADGQRWMFLTGARDTLNDITTELHMNKIDEPMMHSASFVLIDKAGNVRGYYDSNEAEALQKLKRDYRLLLNREEIRSQHIRS